MSPHLFLPYAFDMQESVWENLSIIPRYLRWDQSRKRFHCEKSTLRIHLSFANQILAIFPFFLVHIYLFLKGLWCPAVNTTINWILSGTVFLATLLGIMFGALEFFMRDELQRYHNCLIRLYDDFCSSSDDVPPSSGDDSGRMLSWNEALYQGFLLLLRSNRNYLFGMMNCTIIMSCAIVPLLAPVVLLLLVVHYDIQIDPFNLFLDSVAMSTKNMAYQLPITAYYFVALTELAKMISLALSLQLQSAIHVLWILKKIRPLSGPGSGPYISKALLLYKAMMVLVADARAYTSSMTFTTMSVGYAIMMASSSITVFCFYLLPLPVFSGVVGVTTICLLFLMFGLPVATSHFEETIDLIREWKRESHEENGWNRRILRKELNALFPVVFYFGNLRKMNSDAKVEYLDSISGRTIDACLLLHQNGN